MARLRRATLRDLDLLVLHRRRMFEDMGEAGTPAQRRGHDARYRRWLAARLRARQAAAWVATGRAGPVASGVAWLREVQPRPGMLRDREPYLMSMYTEPAARGVGWASRIVRAAMAWSRGLGYPLLRLHASDAGRRVYARLGFTRSWEMRRRLPPATRRSR